MQTIRWCNQSPWVGHSSNEQGRDARHMLDCVEKWAIDFYRDWWRGVFENAGNLRHHHSSRRGGFGSFFIHRDECLVKHIRDLKVLVRPARRHSVEVSAALRLIERRLHSERLQVFRKRNGWRLDLEF